METIEQRVRRNICEGLGCKDEELKPETRFVADLGADSLDEIELVMMLEEEFETEVSDEEAEQIQTVQQAIDFATARFGTTATS